MNLAFFTGMPGGSEIIIVLFLVLLLFGGKKLPELARALGRSLSEFRKGREDGGAARSADDKTKALNDDQVDRLNEPPAR